MNIAGGGFFILLLLAAAAFAWRGVVLLCTKRVRPGRVISFSGAAAMVAIWVLLGATPFACAAFAGIFQEFDLGLPPATELTFAVFSLAFRYAVLWYPMVLGLSVCALLMPDVFFGRRQTN